MPPRRVALLAATLPFLLAGCFERPKPVAEDRRVPVQATRVALAPPRDTRAFAGVIKPRHEADIAFRAGGRITRREVDVGTVVSAGQVLARLDPTDLELAVRVAQAELSSAEAQARQASADARRTRILTAEGWTAAATDEVKQAAARAADERVASARAALALARNRQDYAVLTAPAAGVVTAVMADPGTVMAEGQPVIRLAEAGELEAEVALPETAAATVGTPASVTVWSRPDVALTARLRELSPAADPRLRTFTARFTLAEAPAWLAQGMTATVHLGGTGTGADVARLPAAALTDRGAGPIVWVVPPDGDRVEPRPVAVVSLADGLAEVRGLHADELVVALGVQKLDPAARVRVVDIRPVAG